MTTYGLALLPELAVREQFACFQREHKAFIHGPQLGMTTNLPHMTLLQCPFDHKQLNGALLFEIVEACRDGLAERTAHFGELYYQPQGWLFADIITEWAHATQTSALQVMSSHIDVSTIANNISYEGYSQCEIESYERYGYRYADERAFRPHLTLGRTVDDSTSVEPDLLKSFSEHMAGQEFLFTEMVFCEVGEFGVLTKTIDSKRL